MKYRLLHWLGISALWRWWHRKHVTILMLHGVMGPSLESRWTPARWQLDPRKLREYLDHLKKYYTFVTANEAVEMIAGQRPVIHNAMVFTIDDGYLNAFDVAAPIFREYGISPLVFVVTGKLDRPTYFWFDRLDLALQNAANHTSDVSFAGRNYALKPDDKQLIRRTCKQIVERSRECFPIERQRADALEGFIDGLREFETTTDEGSVAVRRWVGVAGAARVAAALEEGVDIGSHTVSHIRISNSESDVVRRELRESRRQLEDLLGQDCDFFCYPEGAWSPETADHVADAGYVAAFTSDNGLNAVGSNVMALRRIHLPEDVDKAELLVAVSGLQQTVHAFRARKKGELISGTEVQSTGTT